MELRRELLIDWCHGKCLEFGVEMVLSTTLPVLDTEARPTVICSVALSNRFFLDLGHFHWDEHLILPKIPALAHSLNLFVEETPHQLMASVWFT
jgi:hypothetical protein